jgi:murein DD-endopeptidase MepM/ murein hydrolase activator NlpD
MLLLKSFVRIDSEGNGNFGSRRGGRPHNGTDFAAMPGMHVLSPVAGIVTKIGYPYADDLSYRYVEITTPDELRHRFFYVAPLTHIKPGAGVDMHDTIGIVQNVSARYSDKMIPHVHYEIKKPDGSFINPIATLFPES